MSGPLPAWIERLLGIQTEPGEGAIWSLSHSWRWPPWMTLLFVIVAAAFVVGVYLTESGRTRRVFRMALATIRLLLILLLLLMIAQFALALSRTGLPYVAVVVDDSLSMTVVDQYDEDARKQVRRRLASTGSDELSRWNVARAILTERNGQLLEGIRKNYKLRLYFLTGPRASQTSDTVELTGQIRSTEPVGDQTRLGAGVKAVLDDLRGTAPAAVILFTDGINTEGPTLAEAVQVAQRRGVPLFAIGLGNEEPVRDLKLTDLLVEEVVFVDDVVSFDAKLTATGLQGRDVKVTLRQEGRPDVLTQTTVNVSSESQAEPIRLTHRPKQQGEFQYVMEVESLEEELETENNRQKRKVRVSDQKIQVLLVQSYPSFEFRYLWNMLHRDSTINVHAVLQQADLESVLGDTVEDDKKQALWAFPVRRDDLFQYDVIVLGDADPTLLTPSMMQNLADFVDKPGKGGALVLLAGPGFMPSTYRGTPLERLMPIDLDRLRYPDADAPIEEGFPVEPTELGHLSPQMQLGDTPDETQAIWKNLPPLYWMIEAAKLKPGARALAVNPQRPGPDGKPLPVIVMQYVGAGKVLLHATDETYRWRYRVGDVFFARYWVQTIRYLSRSKLAEGSRLAILSSDRRRYTTGQSVRLRLRFADERMAPAEDRGVRVILERAGQQTRRVELVRSPAGRGTFEGLITKPAMGTYHAWVAVPTLEGDTPTIDFTVEAPPGEFERVETETAQLRRAAERTGGRFYTAQTAHRLLGDLPSGRQVPVETLPPLPLWNTWPVLALFLLLLITEWILRKMAGMV